MRDINSPRFAFPARPRVRVGPDDAPVGAILRPALSAVVPSAVVLGATALSTALAAALLEACRYACGSPRSHLHQRAALRGLDDRRLSDLGLTRREARTGRCEGADGP